MCIRDSIDSAPTALPSDITNLPEITATLWVTVSDDAADRMEGPIFDEKGALYVCHRHKMCIRDSGVAAALLLPSCLQDGERGAHRLHGLCVLCLLYTSRCV